MDFNNEVLYRAALASLAIRNKPKFSIETFCFKEQTDFIRDQRQFKTAVCSRRAGKSVGCAADLIDTALTYKDVVCLYITLKRVNAKRIIWPELLRINREYELGGSANETDLSLRFANGSIIYCSGAKDKSEIENFRGLALKKVYIDECQSFRPHIEELVDDVISKALFDYSGQLCLTGTPGMVPAGYFFNCATSDSWSHHAWTMFSNPHLERKSGKPVLTLVQDDCARMGVDISHPKIQRECYGRWVADLDFLVFKYNADKNHYADVDYRKDWEFVIGVDLGFDDADAIAVVGWHKHQRIAYLIREDVRTKQGITELSEQLERLIKEFDPLKVVVDSGGLGKKIAEEMRRRYSLPIVAAEKSRKFEFIEILNDALRTQRFFAKRDGYFAQDSMLVEWDRDVTNPDKLKISDGYHSDICFVAGTLIQTDKSQVPIEDISIGDLVMTRDGLKDVLASAMTSPQATIMKLEFSNGSNLICTPKHPIFTQNRGFIPADALLYSDRCIISPLWQQNLKQKLLNLMVVGLRDIQIQGAQLIKTIIADILVMAEALVKKQHYIEPYGNSIMEIPQKGITSTIKMEIPLTMNYQISNAFRKSSTIKDMRQIDQVGEDQKEAKGILIKLEKWLLCGMDQMKALLGISNMQNIGKKNLEPRLKPNALFANQTIKEIPYLGLQYFIVLINVVRELGVNLVKIMKNVFVSFVNIASGLINIQKLGSVAVLVRPQVVIGTASVYNITVKDKPEYFANGILVHNCDAVLYAFRESLHWLSEAAPVKIVPQTPAWYQKQIEEMEQQALKNLESQNTDDMWKDMEFE